MMLLAPSVIVGMVAACAASHPAVRAIPDPAAVVAHAEQESGRDPLVVHVNEDRGRYLPEESVRFTSADKAVAYTQRAVAAGRSVDVGVMGINLRAHPDAFATLADAFDPAVNVCAGAIILGQDYRTARAAQCLYNTGHMACANGYPEAIDAAARRLRGQATQVAVVAEAPPSPAQVSDPAVPEWDAYGQARLARNVGR